MTTSNPKEVRVRFAPSPTGYLHIGGARTAIFNWLFARKNKGKFLLRIEDTDQARSGPEMIQAIYDGLQWLGLKWDEAPVFQSQRIELYRQYSQYLIEKQKAYYCYCSPEKLQQEREKALQEKKSFRADDRCRNLTAAERAELQKSGVAPVVRFKVPEGVTTFTDIVHGSLTFHNHEIDDFALLRSDGMPTYHLAVVVDDREMGITHVIRGDDHLSNTPKQVLLYQAFGWEIPQFAHVPMILGPDKKRLSKRHGATSISEYEKAGYLPRAMVNFLALLGWNPGDDREIMSLEDLIEAFDLSGISKKSAIFDETKLEWMNGEYINALSENELVERVIPFLISGKILPDGGTAQSNREYIKRVVLLLKSRAKRLTDFVKFGRYFFHDPQNYDEEVVRKYWNEEGVAERLKRLRERLSEISQFNAAAIEAAVRGLAEQSGVSAAKLIHPTRLALTGFGVGPGLFEVMEVLGKEVVLRRLDKAIQILVES
ncbi:MAG: glutamate--tRNA ligase [candidate division KSB1 bacterium]|nr:glutamate--tRNA ligase [candidate division KSB1 bacterium]